MGERLSTPDPGVLDSMYTRSVDHGFLQDVGVDVSFQRFSFADSDATLQRYFRETLAEADGENRLPEYIKDLGQGLGPLTKAPNAVGLAAVVISMFLQTLMGLNKEEDAHTRLQHVFSDEKSKAIFSTMDNYMKQHRIHIHDEAELRDLAKQAKDQISLQLVALRHVMMGDQMSTRYLKSWANGAAFHVLLLAHIANMKHAECGQLCSGMHQSAAHNAVRDYQRTLDRLLDKYKEYTLANIKLDIGVTREYCYYQHLELKTHFFLDCIPAYRTMYRDAVVERMFSNPDWVAALKDYFADLSSNLNALMTRHGVFHVPTCRELQRTYPRARVYCQERY